MNNLFVNPLKKDTNKASQFKIQLEILPLLFPKKVKAKVFTKFCLNNIDNKKVLWRHNKKNQAAIVKDQNASSYTANAFRDSYIVIKIVNVMTVEIVTKINKHIKKQLYLHQQEMQEVLKMKRNVNKKQNLIKALAWESKYKKLEKDVNARRLIA